MTCFTEYGGFGSRLVAALPVQLPGFILLKTSLSLYKGLRMKNHKFIKAVVFTLSVLAVTAGFISCED